MAAVPRLCRRRRIDKGRIRSMLADLGATYYRGSRPGPHDMTLRSLITRSSAAVAATLAMAGSCRDLPLAPVTPDLPAGAEALTPLATYTDWWSETERCAGLYRSMSRVRWFVVPNRTS